MEARSDRAAYLLRRLRDCGARPVLRVGRLHLERPSEVSDTLRGAALGWRVEIEQLLRRENEIKSEMEREP